MSHCADPAERVRRYQDLQKSGSFFHPGCLASKLSSIVFTEKRADTEKFHGQGGVYDVAIRAKAETIGQHRPSTNVEKFAKRSVITPVVLSAENLARDVPWHYRVDRLSSNELRIIVQATVEETDYKKWLKMCRVKEEQRGLITDPQEVEQLARAIWDRHCDGKRSLVRDKEYGFDVFSGTIPEYIARQHEWDVEKNKAIILLYEMG